MQPHPHSRRATGRPSMSEECTLRRDRGRDGVSGALESDKYGVALNVDFLPAPLPACGAEQLPVLGQDLGIIGIPKTLEDARGSFDIRKEEGHGPRRHARHKAAPSSRQEFAEPTRILGAPGYRMGHFGLLPAPSQSRPEKKDPEHARRSTDGPTVLQQCPAPPLWRSPCGFQIRHWAARRNSRKDKGGRPTRPSVLEEIEHGSYARLPGAVTA